MPGTEFKNQVDNLMNILFGAGVASHATIIEQINYLVFLRSLSKKDDNAMILDSSAEKIFSGELAKYHWDNLLVLNAEVLFTTLEEIFRKLPELATDQTIRLLFRDAHVKIFDKPTLRRLVHEIEKMMSELEKEASSGHTDIFGDMYEYLLSKQAQAGTLGQFRTPRHIIKFIVDIIDPNKGETILDPACGTAGFLVSALEHLKEKYTSGELKKEGRLVMDKLSKGERDFVYQNTFTGFDSDFDMFKFGLMNLYLHKLEHPNIKRQNTLVDTAGDRTKWDIILANPPFAGALDQDSVSEDLRMNTRATEVLFLKYIVDHLSQNGRAGVIVPEGVLFNSTNAHKKIRQILVEDAGLWCVVSLPSGVFNPYAGVKTSILFFDKNMKDKFKNVLFYKTEADGFELGAQRRENGMNDLPHALETITNYRLWTIANQETSRFDYSNEPLATLVEKKNISESGDYALSAERYHTQKEYSNTKWPSVSLGEISEILNGYTFKSEKYSENGIRIIRITNVQKGFVVDDDPRYYPEETKNEISRFLLKKNDLLISLTGNVGRVGLVRSEQLPAALNQRVGCIRLKSNAVTNQFIYHLLNSNSFENDCVKNSSGVAQKNLSTEWLKNYKIPLPPLEIQNKIVEELDGYQNIICGAKQVIESWKPDIKVDNNWEVVKLPEICEIKRGKFSYRPRNAPHLYGGEYPFIQTGDVVRANGGIVGFTQTLNEEGLKVSKLFNPIIVLVTIAANIGDTAILDYSACFPDSVVGLIPNDKVSPHFLQLIMSTKKEELDSMAPQMAQKNINIEILKKVKIPIPTLETQKQIVEKIEEERKLVEGNRKLIENYQQKITDKISNIWNSE